MTKPYTGGDVIEETCHACRCYSSCVRPHSGAGDCTVGSNSTCDNCPHRCRTDVPADRRYDDFEFWRELPTKSPMGRGGELLLPTGRYGHRVQSRRALSCEASQPADRRV